MRCFFEDVSQAPYHGEEKDYLERYRNGDLKAKDVLIERNLRLVAHVVRKYQTAEDEMDDLISIGTIGLIKAVSTFDGNRNSKLGTYAAKCIENAMLTSGHLRRKKFRRCPFYYGFFTENTLY